MTEGASHPEKILAYGELNVKPTVHIITGGLRLTEGASRSEKNLTYSGRFEPGQKKKLKMFGNRPTVYITSTCVYRRFAYY